MRPHGNQQRKERAVLVGVELPSNDHKIPLEYSLKELESLAQTAGAEVAEKFTQELRSITP
ncbi:MAG TPA: hypothetical protein VMR88_07700, partial [Candidatus Polarisedimenticolaceae bacterium]|nr:hypothetical protein [Candidatus Polarisedimenticolaceae bacterium]